MPTEPTYEHVHKAAREIAEWQEYRVRDALGRFLYSKATRVVVRKPRWIPWGVFRALMRTIVLEERDERAPAATRRERRDVKRRR